MEVEDYDNYIIYEDGRVYSKKSKKYLKHNPNTYGYLHVTLYKDGNKEDFLIHRLVALHYIENPHNYPEVDHIDRDKCNNHLYNLRWCDRSMNSQNRDVHKNNKLQIKNICYSNRHKIYIFKKTINGKKHEKYFKTLEEAIQYKEDYLTDLQVE
jgi:hydroxymethylpyrimidine pyrophosphatase-like HAD family hydrolase